MRDVSRKLSNSYTQESVDKTYVSVDYAVSILVENNYCLINFSNVTKSALYNFIIYAPFLILWCLLFLKIVYC
jgi:hypothetical protein